MPDSQNLAIRKRAPIARCLFGRPNPNSTWLRDRLNEMRQHEETTWNFDFVNDRPLTSSSSTSECSSSNWEYTAVSTDALPAFYHPKVCIIPPRKKQRQPMPPPDTRLASPSPSLLLSTDLLSPFIDDESSDSLVQSATTMHASQPKITAYFGLSRSRKRQHSRSLLKKDTHPSSLSTSNRLLL